MLIRSIQQHWPARKLEWIMAGALSTWGLYTLVHPEIFTNPESAAMVRHMAAMVEPISPFPALVWGGGASLVGLLRLTALVVNGKWTRTPLCRTVASFASLFIIAQIFIGLQETGLPNWGVVVYPWLAVADILSAFRSSVDMVHAEKQREVEKENRRAYPATRVSA